MNDLRPATVRAIFYRDWLVFRRVWFSLAFGSIIEPLITFLAFGFGFGALVADVAGLSYLEFIATGAVMIGVLFSSMFPGLINGYFRRKEQHLYDGLLAAPVSVAEVVTGEALFTALRCTIVAITTVVVAVIFGVDFGPGVLAVPLIAVVMGFAFACTGAAFASRLRSTHSFDFVIVGVIVPMFIVAGTFFPVDALPRWVQVVALINPMYHALELLRAAVFGTSTVLVALGHALVVLVATALAWWLAVRLLRDALID